MRRNWKKYEGKKDEAQLCLRWYDRNTPVTSRVILVIHYRPCAAGLSNRKEHIFWYICYISTFDLETNFNLPG